MSNKRNIKKIFLHIVCLICIILIIISSYKIIEWFKENNENKKIMDSIYETAIVIENNNKYHVNMEELRKANTETVGWIKIQNTNIEYPIVKTTDNSFYLDHSFDKSYNKAGWIFADYRNKLDGTDRNIVIYGLDFGDSSDFVIK